jgi:hypothetical protein
MAQTRKTRNLNISKVLSDFTEYEKSPKGRKGTFKINKPFEEAIDAILRAKPTSVKSKRDMR